MAKKDDTSRSWFAVFNNPKEHGYIGTPDDIICQLRDEWINDFPTRSGAWTYCISSEGLEHVHMVLEDEKPMRFSAIKKSYAFGMHFEPTKGSKSDALDYINKIGRFEEKDEKVIAKIHYGEIKACQGQRKDLEIIDDMISNGLSPNEIFSRSIRYRKHEKEIISAYIHKRCNETPIVRSVVVYWHFGKSGTGKSHSFVNLVNKFGEDDVYFISDFSNGCFDGYYGQRCLFLDEFRNQFSFSYLLQLLDKYKSPIHARYQNRTTLWSEVHITSVYAPDEYFEHFVSKDLSSIDEYKQLLRRLTFVVYHYCGSDGSYNYFSLPAESYINRENIVRDSCFSFRPYPDNLPNPFA